MSQFSSGGAVVPVTADLTAAYAELNNFRKEAGKAVVMGGQSGIAGSGSPLQQARAAFSPGVAPAVPGTTPMTFAAAAAAGVGAAPFTPSASNVNAQLVSTLNELKHVIRALADGARGAGAAAARSESGGDSGSSGGSRSGLGFGQGGLARYLGAGFLTREALSVVQHLQGNNIQAGLAAAAGDPFAGYQRESGIDAVVSGIPLVGQLYNVITSGEREDALRAEQEARYGQRSATAASQRYISGLGSANNINTLQRQTALLSDPNARPGTFEAGAKAALNDTETFRRQQTLHDQTVSQQIIALRGTDPRAAADLHADLRAYERAAPGELAAQRALNEARAAEQLRLRGNAVRSLLGRRSGLEAAAAGNFGQASGLEFEAGLNDAALSADERSPLLGWITRTIINPLRRQGRQAETTAGINLRDAGTVAAYSMLAHRPLAAQLEEIGGREQDELANARSDADKQSIRMRAEADRKLAVQNFGEAGLSQGFGIRTRTENLNLQSGFDPRTAGQPAGVATALARLNDIVRGTQGQMAEAFLSGHAELIPGISQQGQAGVRAFRADAMRTVGEEVDPFTQSLDGQGTGDSATILKSISDAVDQVRKMPETLDDIRNLLKGIKGA